MFTRRRQLDRRRRYTREFLESFVDKLRDAGFDEISMILPHNYESVDPKDAAQDVKAFLDRDRNFAAVILVAVSTRRNEKLKVLFVNSNKRAVFADDTFPMAESEPSGMYFESPDPARTYGLFEYFFDYLGQPAVTRFVVLTAVGLASLLYILLQIAALVSKGAGIIQVQTGTSAWADAVSTALAVFGFFRFSSAPTGLWVKPKRELKIVYLINMTLKGQFRDNPIVQLVVTIIGGLLVMGLAKLFGWL